MRAGDLGHRRAVGRNDGTTTRLRFHDRDAKALAQRWLDVAVERRIERVHPFLRVAHDEVVFVGPFDPLTEAGMRPLVELNDVRYGDGTRLRPVTGMEVEIRV